MSRVDGDTAEQVVCWTEYAVQFPDGSHSSPMPRRQAEETVANYAHFWPNQPARVARRIVTPWRVLP